MPSSKRSPTDSSHVRAAGGTADAHVRSLEQELATLRQTLAERDAALLAADRLRALGALTATMLHDLGNHVTVQRSCAELLASSATDPELAEVSADLRTSLAHSAQVLTRLATLAHGEPLAQRSARLDEIARATLRWLAHLLPARARIEPQLDAGDAVAALDGAVLAQLVLDLVLHARDQLPEAGGTIRLETERARSSREVLTRVTAPDGREVSTWRRAASGEVPAALAIAAQLVRAAGGELEVPQRVERGTAFRVRLPLAP